jgi:adenosylcobinamide-GDP ribazoletransferase
MQIATLCMSLGSPLRIAAAFLTRLPVQLGEAAETEVGRALACFPIVGLGLGTVLTGAAWLASTLPPFLSAVGLVALLAAATGGLHLDGLADVFDALGGSHGNRARMLAIMRDSRIGAHGALALLLVVLAKVSAVSALLQRGSWWAILLFPAVARGSVVPLVVAFPYVRADGLGRRFKDQGSAAELVWATAFTAAMLLCAGARALTPAALAFAAALGFGVWMRRRLGGQTGDTYGAAIELAEVAFLAAAARGA